MLASYAAHADAVSVLTDERFFGGSLQRLAEVRKRLEQPLLCKDFILEPYQVAEARAHGADAILLILAAVDDATWSACAAAAERFGMEVLTEVHDAEEVARATALGAAIIGVNHRNLQTLQVDMSTTARLAPRIPADRLVIAESGIASRRDVTTLRPHADAFLVGSALMREADLDGAVRRLVYGKTKVCGLTSAAGCRGGARGRRDPWRRGVRGRVAARLTLSRPASSGGEPRSNGSASSPIRHRKRSPRPRASSSCPRSSCTGPKRPSWCSRCAT